MKQLKALIVEDDPIIGQILLSYLSSYLEASNLEIALSGTEALRVMEHQTPDLLFVDVEIPDIDGLSIAVKAKTANPSLSLVFVTGHTQYAAQAFKLDAIDYLVKPVTEESVRKAMSKIKRARALSVINTGEAEVIIIKNSYEIYFIRQNDIIFIERSQRKSIFHTIKGKYYTNEALNAIAKRLGGKFFRCHKSFIINTEMVEKCIPIAERIYEIVFYDYKYRVTTNRKKLEELYNMRKGNNPN